MKKILGLGLLVGLINLILGLALSQFSYFVWPSLNAEYQNPALFRSWSDPLMSIYFVCPFLVGLILAWLWEKTKGLFKGSYFRRGFSFGLIYWLISIPGMVISYSSFPISIAMVFSWTLSGLIQYLVGGFILAKGNR